MDAATADTSDPRVLADLLAGRLTEVLGQPAGVADVRRLTGGASRETWAFTALLGQGAPRRLVLRRDPPGTGRPEGMALEARVLAVAARAGVAVPPLLDAGTDPAVVGSPYLIMDHVDGETIARRLLRDPQYERARAGLAAELGRTLARIHAIAPEAVPGLAADEPLEGLRAAYGELGEPLPTVEIALKWLERHRPDDVAPTVVHGDFRTGNLIIDPTGLRAVLDWERVHSGDPREDLGWLCVKCWRFGSPHPVGGFGSVAELLRVCGGRGHAPRPRGRAMVADLRHRELGGGLPHNGGTASVRADAVGGARRDRPPGVRTGARRAARPRTPSRASRDG